MKNKSLKIALASFVSLSAYGADVPRGHQVDPIAGNCGIGPIPQTGKAGRYNRLCETMPEGEKCLAFLKQHFNPDGTTQPTYDQDKTEYCLDALGDELIHSNND